MALEKKIGTRRFFKKAKKVDEQTFKIGFFYKGGEDLYVNVHKDILVEVMEVNESVLEKSEASAFITLYLKKPELIKAQNVFLKKHRLLIEAMDALLSKHENVNEESPILSFENIDHYLGKVKGHAQHAFTDTSYKKFA